MSEEVSQVLELAAKRRQLELLQRRKQLRRENGLLGYKPHTKQIDFHASADKKYRYARTGNRFGKSEMGAAEDAAFALGYRPWIPEGDPRRTVGIPQRPTKGLIITTDWEKSTEVFTNMDGEPGKLMRFLPKDEIVKITKNHSGAVCQITLKNGSRIHFDTVKSYKQNPLGQESSDWDWLHIDEPCPRAMFVANARGLVDRNGKAWFTCTPLTEPWINDFFAPELGADLEEGLPFCAADDKWMMMGSMHDNPYLTKEAIESFVALLTPDERECRINGLPTAMAGLVYKEFKWNEHVLKSVPVGWSDYDLPPPNYTIRYAIDPHPRTPHAVLFIATSPEGYSFVYDEIFNACLVSELCQQIRSRSRSRWIQTALIDPISNTKNPITGKTMRDTFIEEGVDVAPAMKDPSSGILCVREMLRGRDQEGNPILYFSPRVQRTLFEISRGYIWDGEKGKPLDQDDHMMENLYRLCLNGLEYVEPPATTDIQDFVRLRRKQTQDMELALVADDLSIDLYDTPKPKRNRLTSSRYRR